MRYIPVPTFQKDLESREIVSVFPILCLAPYGGVGDAEVHQAGPVCCQSATRQQSAESLERPATLLSLKESVYLPIR